MIRSTSIKSIQQLFILCLQKRFCNWFSSSKSPCAYQTFIEYVNKNQRWNVNIHFLLVFICTILNVFHKIDIFYGKMCNCIVILLMGFLFVCNDRGCGVLSVLQQDHVAERNIHEVYLRIFIYSRSEKNCNCKRVTRTVFCKICSVGGVD